MSKKLMGAPWRQQRILAAMPLDDDTPYLSFKGIASRSGVDLCHIRRDVRHLARKGLMKFAKGLWTDEGDMAGSGYAITEAGRTMIKLGLLASPAPKGET
jgi:hypothetical protein